VGHTTPAIGGLARIDGAIFWTEARDLIEPQLVIVPPDSALIQLQNIAAARIAGVDLTVLAAPIPDHLTASLAYTFLSTRRNTPGTTTPEPLAFRPRHLLTLSADYALPAAITAGADFRYASRPERIELEGFVDPRRVAVKVLDLRAAWKRGPLDVRLLVANALDYIYNLVPETLAPVRTVTVTAVWTH
jgi:iron complex outermembrane receptor protein